MTLVVLGATVLLAGAGIGVWYGWDTGLLPGNPRAPTMEAMQPVVQRAVYPVLLAQGYPCVGPTSHVRADVQGQPGIAHRNYPGQHSVVFIVPGNEHDVASRALAIEQYAFLAGQGFYADDEVTVETEVGPKVARRFQLTWKGFASMVNSRQADCFYAGTRQFAGVKSIDRLPGTVSDMVVYEVGYETSIQDLAAWARTAKAQQLFPDLAQRVSTRRESLRLIRGKSGWLTETEVALQLQLARVRATESLSAATLHQLERSLGQPVPLDEVATRAALDAYLTGDAWQGRGSLACLPLRLQRGGDERSTPQDRASFATTWHDAPPGARRDSEQHNMLTQLHILAALEAAGLASLEEVKGGIVNKITAPTGVRFSLNASGLALLGASGAGCLPAGRMNVELLGVNTLSPTEARLAMRATLSGTPDWVAAIAQSLPALRSMIAYGVPLLGRLSYMDNAAAMTGGFRTAGGWEVFDVSPAYPQIAAADLAPVLQPYLPATARAAAVRKTVTSPIHPSGSTGKNYAGGALGSGEPARIHIIGPAAPRAPAPSSRPDATGTLEPPYPAGDADVHFVAVYQGVPAQGGVREAQQKPEGVVNIVIGKTTTPVLLLAMAYEPVEWRVGVESGARLAKVVAIGMRDQRVTILGAQGIETVIRRADVLASAGLDETANWFPYEPRGDGALDGEAITRAVTGKPPMTYQGRYTGEGVFLVNATTRPWAAPPLRSAEALSPEPVVLRSTMSHAVDGLAVAYGGAGAYTEAWSSRALSAGKAYFEGLLSVTGGGYASSHANVGIGRTTPEGALDEGSGDSVVPLIPPGHQRLYRDGDVFGVAVDFDAGMVYFRVNGGWVNGEPGSGKGQRLRTRRTHVAYFFATGGGPGGPIGWRANFGGSAFRHPLPKGYLSWDGTQRG